MPGLCVCEVLLSLEQAVKTARHPSAIARHNAIYFFVCFQVFPPFDFDVPILTSGAKAALKQLVVFLWKLFLTRSIFPQTCLKRSSPDELRLSVHI